MIVFETLRYKNILSTGDNWTKVDLSGNGTTLIIGENGAGKSTILDAICFVLYGKAFRKVTLPALINSINQKGLLVEIQFTTRGHQYKVIRGMKPKKFEVWKDDELVNQDAKATDYQAELEDNILQMNFKTFGQIVILGSSTFVPFMQLTAAARRDFIEDLLDLEMFSTMGLLLKAKMKEVKEEIVDYEHKRELCQSKIESAKKHNATLTEMKEDALKKIKDDADVIIADIEQNKECVDEYQQKIDDAEHLVKDLPKATREFRTLDNTIDRIEHDISRLKKEIRFLDKHDNCPTCQQEIDAGFKKGKKEELEEHIIDEERRMDTLLGEKNSLEDIISDMEKVERDIRGWKSEISGHNATISAYKRTLQKLRDDYLKAKQDAEKSIDVIEIDTLEDEQKTYDEELTKLYDEHETQKNVLLILKDGGIRARVIKQYIPIINKMINRYLSKMDFFVNFELDGEFKESIKSRHRDEFTYASFSEGEKAKIDISLMLTWRAVAKMRNSATTNLLILDEIFDGSLDLSGVNYLSEILNKDVENSNIFVISHKIDQYADQFDSTCMFKKVKGFSMMEEV